MPLNMPSYSSASGYKFLTAEASGSLLRLSELAHHAEPLVAVPAPWMGSLFSDQLDALDNEILAITATFGVVYPKMLCTLLGMRGHGFSARSMTPRLLRLRTFGYLTALTVESTVDSTNQSLILHLAQKGHDYVRGLGLYAWVPQGGKPAEEVALVLRKRLIAGHCVVNCLLANAKIRSFRLGPVLNPNGPEAAVVRPSATMLGSDNELICLESIIRTPNWKRELLQKIIRYEEVLAACKAPLLLFLVPDEPAAREIDMLLKAIDSPIPVLYCDDRNAAEFYALESGKRKAYSLATAFDAV